MRDSFADVRIPSLHAKLDYRLGTFIDAKRRIAVVTPGKRKRPDREMNARVADPDREDHVRKVVHEILRPFRAQPGRPGDEARADASDLSRKIVVEPAFAEQAGDHLARKLRNDAGRRDRLLPRIVRRNTLHRSRSKDRRRARSQPCHLATPARLASSRVSTSSCNAATVSTLRTDTVMSASRYWQPKCSRSWKTAAG